MDHEPVNCKRYFVYSKCHHSLVSSCLHEKESTPTARNCTCYSRRAGDQDSKVGRHVGEQNSSGSVHPTFMYWAIS